MGDENVKIQTYARFALKEYSDIRVGYYNGGKAVRISNEIDVHTNRQPLPISAYGTSSDVETNNKKKINYCDTVFLTEENFSVLTENFREIQLAYLNIEEKEVFLGLGSYEDEEHKYVHRINRKPSVATEPRKIVFRS